MRSYLTPLAGGIVLGALGFWLLGGVLAATISGADHSPGPGKFADWTGPKEKFLHIYLWVSERDGNGCPLEIDAIPTDEAAEIWKKAFSQPKRIVWKINNRDDGDKWTIQTKPNTPDHLPGAKVIPAGGDDAYWTAKPSPVGKPVSSGGKTYWKWMYNVTVKRDGCAAETLDPPVYIRR